MFGYKFVKVSHLTVMESDLRKLTKNLFEIKGEFEEYKNDTSDYYALKSENESLRNKVEELTKTNELLKNSVDELSKKSADTPKPRKRRKVAKKTDE